MALVAFVFRMAMSVKAILNGADVANSIDSHRSIWSSVLSRTPKSTESNTMT